MFSILYMFFIELKIMLFKSQNFSVFVDNLAFLLIFMVKIVENKSYMLKQYTKNGQKNNYEYFKLNIIICLNYH